MFCNFLFFFIVSADYKDEKRSPKLVMFDGKPLTYTMSYLKWEFWTFYKLLIRWPITFWIEETRFLSYKSDSTCELEFWWLKVLRICVSEYVDLQRSCAGTTSSDIVLTWEIREFLFRVGIVCMSGMNDL